MEYAPPDFEPPYRVLLLVASTGGWYAASAGQRGQALDGLGALFEQAHADGARLVGSFDDDLFATGQPSSLPYSIFALYDVDDLGVIVRMAHELRMSDLGRMIRFEARIGRRLFLLAN